MPSRRSDALGKKVMKEDEKKKGAKYHWKAECNTTSRSIGRRHAAAQNTR